MKRWNYWLTVLLVLAPAAIAEACPSCKESIANTNAQDAAGVPSGFNYSIYYMLISFFTVLGLVVGVIVKGIRSANVAVPPRE